MSQENLADASGLQRTYVSALERGRKDPRVSMIVRLADALDVRPGELLERPDDSAAPVPPPVESS